MDIPAVQLKDKEYYLHKEKILHELIVYYTFARALLRLRGEYHLTWLFTNEIVRTYIDITQGK